MQVCKAEKEYFSAFLMYFDVYLFALAGEFCYNIRQKWKIWIFQDFLLAEIWITEMGYCGVFRKLTLRRKFFCFMLKEQGKNPTDVKTDEKMPQAWMGMKFLENVQNAV